jgi:hypothetical protein
LLIDSNSSKGTTASRAFLINARFVAHRGLRFGALSSIQELASRFQWLRFSTLQCSRIILPGWAALLLLYACEVPNRRTAISGSAPSYALGLSPDQAWNPLRVDPVARVARLDLPASGPVHPVTVEILGDSGAWETLATMAAGDGGTQLIPLRERARIPVRLKVSEN